jgi:hypothetical protein
MSLQLLIVQALTTRDVGNDRLQEVHKYSTLTDEIIIAMRPFTLLLTKRASYRLKMLGVGKIALGDQSILLDFELLLIPATSPAIICPTVT